MWLLCSIQNDSQTITVDLRKIVLIAFTKFNRIINAGNRDKNLLFEIETKTEIRKTE